MAIASSSIAADDKYLQRPCRCKSWSWIMSLKNALVNLIIEKLSLHSIRITTYKKPRTA